MLLLDGANIIDPGCNCWSTAVVNPEFTQEVKVSTSNFGADQPNGPVVFSTTSKSGTSTYHGSAYLTLRNAVLNANTWQNKNNVDPAKRTARQDAAWYYPGGTFGGPVPFTHNKLLFWGGYEYYWQKLPSQNPLTAWVPTASMRAGNFDFNAADNKAVCTASGASLVSPEATNFCNDLTGTILPNGQALPAGTTNIAPYIDPNMVNLMNAYFPEPNADPAQGYNWYMPISSQQNGWVYRARVDYNFSDNTKFYISYQKGANTGFQPAHIWWNPGNSVPFPGGGITNPTDSKTLSLNFLHVFSPTLTNEAILTWNRANSPYQPNDLSAAYKSTIGWNYQTVFGKGANDLMAPGIYSAGSRSFGEMSQGDIFQHGGEFGLLKATPSFQDNVSKAIGKHTFKAGFFYSMTGNYQVNFVRPNGVLSFDSIDVKNLSITNLITGQHIGSLNPMANFLMGIAYSNDGGRGYGYQEDSQTDVSDMAFRTYSFYGMDDWKLHRRVTLNLGLRFDHIGRWYERSGTGMAVWLPGLYDEDVAAGRTDPGVRWHGVDPGIPISGNQAQVLFASPRIGLAFDVFGSGKTVIRGGWGIYRWNDQYNDYSGALSTAQGLQTFNLSQDHSILVSQLGPQLLNYVSGSPVSGSIYATDPTDRKVPTTYAYNFTISQQMPWHSLLEVAYVGNQSTDLLMGGQSGSSGIGGSDYINVNKIPLGGLFNRVDPVNGSMGPANLEASSCSPTTCPVGSTWDFQHYFPYYAGYGTNSIRVGEHVGYSNYNGFQLAWSRQGSRLSYNLNYTWSKALGIVNSTVDAFTVHGNYGILNIDRPHVINTSYSYDLGSPVHANRGFEGVTNGWTISGTTTWQAGADLQANYSSQNLGLSLKDANGDVTTRTYYGTNVGMILPVTTCDPSSGLSGEQHVNLSCLTAPAIGEYGDRTIGARGPAYFNQDLAIHKNFSITERQKFEFRVSAFNLFNHPLWAFANNNMQTLRYVESGSSWTLNNAGTTANFGQTTIKSEYRRVQFGLKYTF